jgi:predicted nuclease of predicted toxin-antitoxin system
LADVFPEMSHVKDFALDRADDETVWQFARDHGFTIVSKDSDFRQRSFLLGAPPRTVWIRLGNCTTQQIESALRVHHDDVVRLQASTTDCILIITA